MSVKTPRTKTVLGSFLSRRSSTDEEEKSQKRTSGGDKEDNVIEPVHAPEVLPIFGLPASEVIQRPDHEGFSVRTPVVVRHCCHSLYRSTFRFEESGLLTEGIFRISAQADIIQEVKHIFDHIGYEKYCEDMGLFSVLDAYDAHAAAGVLKLYLRELDEPLMGFDSYRSVINAVKTNKPPDQIVRIIKGCIDRYLHVADKIMLNIILFLLWETSRISASMKASNLGIVFGQIFFSRAISIEGESDDVNEQMQAISHCNKATAIMIEHYKKLFTGREKYIQKLYEPFYHERFIPESNEEETVTKNPLFKSNEEETEHTGPEDYSDNKNEVEEGFEEEEAIIIVDDASPERIRIDFETLISKCKEADLKKELESLYDRVRPYLDEQ